MYGAKDLEKNTGSAIGPCGGVICIVWSAESEIGIGLRRSPFAGKDKNASFFLHWIVGGCGGGGGGRGALFPLLLLVLHLSSSSSSSAAAAAFAVVSLISISF